MCGGDYRRVANTEMGVTFQLDEPKFGGMELVSSL
jgi:hypothetical protein